MNGRNKRLENAELGIYPKVINYSQKCDLNERIAYSNDVPWERVLFPPTTLKHLYTGIPNYYPFRYSYKPKGTMYDINLTQHWRTGLGKDKVIGGGNYKMWPLTNMMIREERDYNSLSFQRPQIEWPLIPRTQPSSIKSGYVNEGF